MNDYSIHNPQYFLMIAAAEMIEIHIHVNSCDDGTGLQSAIIGTCPWYPGEPDGVLSCDGQEPPGGTMILSIDSAIIGNSYWLMIDGFGGALCEYTITYVSGIWMPDIVDALDPEQTIASPSIVCQGYNSLIVTTGPEIPLAHGYLWTFEWHNGTIATPDPILETNIPPNAPPGIWEICVKAYNGCDTSDTEVCTEIEIVELPDLIKEPVTLCPEEFPITWLGINIQDEGTYKKTFTMPDGCVVDSSWTIEAYPEVPMGYLDTFLCLSPGNTNFYYDTEVFDESGVYDLFYPGGGLNGCDSFAELDLTMIGIIAYVDLTCSGGEFVLTCLIEEVLPFNADIDFFWHRNGEIVWDEKYFHTLQDGCYDLWVTIYDDDLSCDYFIETFCFDAEDFSPPPPDLTNGDTLLCENGVMQFTIIPDPSGDVTSYVWSAPADVVIGQNGSEMVSMDFSNSTGGTVCVFSVGGCGESDAACFDVNFIQKPVADFSSTAACVNEISSIIFTGSGSNDAQFIWNFDNPSSVTGSGIGPYSITWDIPGDKLISLFVIESGCDTSFTSGIIQVTDLVSPIINCSSTINSIEFNWNDVTGASGYLLSVNGGTPFSVPSSEFDTTGLVPGTVINIALTVISGGPCADITITHACTAEDCPPPAIVLSGTDSFCLNAPVIEILSAEVNGNPGMGVWSGPGIINPGLGIFDPKASGPGQHSLTYTVDINGCPFSSPFIVTVFDSITADFTIDSIICITDIANLSYTGNAGAGAEYDYNFSNATIISGTGAGPYQINFNAAGATTFELQVSENGCTSDVITHHVNVGDEPDPPVVNCLANTGSIEFEWPEDTSVMYDLNILTGHSGIQSGNSITFTGLISGDIVSIEIITQSAGPCPERRDTFNCEARLCPMDTIKLTPVDDICLYPNTSPFNLAVEVINGNGVGEWSGDGITNSESGIFDPLMAGAGSHTITYHYLDDGCDFFETMTIDVFDPPVALINNTDFVLTCGEGNILFLDGSESTGENITYLWTTQNGAIIGSYTSTIAEINLPGSYQLKVFEASGCLDSISVEVTQDANTPVSCASPDKILTCDVSSVLLGDCSSTGSTIVYLWTTTDGHISGPVDEIKITVNKPGVYTLLVQDTINGCKSLDSVSVTLDTSVTGILLVPGDTIDCNTPVSEVKSFLGADPADYLFTWSTLDGAIVGNKNTGDIEVSKEGTYTLNIQNKNNGCEKAASVIVPENNEIIEGVEVKAMNITCYGDADGGLIIHSVTGGNPDYTFEWNVQQQSGTSLSSLAPGTYSLTVTDKNGCSLVKIFTLTEPAKFTVDLGWDQTVTEGDLVHIDFTTNISPGAISFIEWSGSPEPDCPGCSSLNYEAIVSAMIGVVVTDTAGCIAYDSMRLTVIIPKINYIPTIFSPNDDGTNDYFHISGRENLISISYLRIYDRWGNQLFEKIDGQPGQEDSGWDGKFRGEQMQSGVYVYVAELIYIDGTETVSGTITLIR